MGVECVTDKLKGGLAGGLGATPPATTTPMTTGTKVAIGVGVAAALAVGYVLLAKPKRGRKKRRSR
jgi:hypothetical protein